MRVFVCDYIRTPIGRYGGGLSTVRTDDLARYLFAISGKASGYRQQDRRGIRRMRQSGRRRQSQRGSDGHLAGASRDRSRGDAESPLGWMQ